MIEQAPRAAREFHVGPAGDRWLLMRDLNTGQPYVLHRPADEPEVELDLGSFLVLFHGQERAGLLDLIASLLPDDEAPAHDEATVVRSPRFLSRWIPSRQN
ncbi:hypothetical protein MKK67_12270 [Methylobacterium sp. J-072]|uniref:hypothetical protein n=1 Tax=Methylobacterium sp. J-072 TaxID=2836651 RepID=UPI001FBAC122|nr:hypothetical protein [Methylobacterium sp. J-072]MCJ2093258.1 hypothetical protein [Methylobacterium sp. J-072]